MRVVDNQTGKTIMDDVYAAVLISAAGRITADGRHEPYLRFCMFDTEAHKSEIGLSMAGALYAIEKSVERNSEYKKYVKETLRAFEKYKYEIEEICNEEEG